MSKSYVVYYELLTTPSQFGNQFEEVDTISGTFDEVYKHLLALKPAKLFIDSKYRIRCSGGAFLKEHLLLVVDPKLAKKLYDPAKCDYKLKRLEIKNVNEGL